MRNSDRAFGTSETAGRVWVAGQWASCVPGHPLRTDAHAMQHEVVVFEEQANPGFAAHFRITGAAHPRHSIGCRMQGV